MVEITGLPSRPHSVKEITEEADSFTFNTTIALKFWIRVATTLYSEAINEKRNGDLEKAYMLFMRHTALLMDHLPKHPESKTPEGKAALKPLRQRFGRVLDEMEDLKPRITASYEEWKKLSTSKEAVQRLRREQAKRQSKILDAGEHQDLAVDLARKELHRRDAARRATRQAGISEEDEHARRGAGVWDSWDVPAANNAPVSQDDDLRSQMDAARRQLELAEDVNAIEQAHLRHSIRRDSPRPDASPVIPSVSYNYPTISKSTPLRYESQPAVSIRRAEPAPLRPPKESFFSPPPIQPPVIPSKQPSSSQTLDAFSSSSQTLPQLPPKVARCPTPPKEERLTFRYAARLENGKGLRSIFIPEGLREAFLALAEPNTRRGLEMCGILCGTAVNNALFVSHLIIPRQICTSDTCETVDENEYLEFCITEDLMIFGWIHTHPTQTCFMSSRDLHTQAGYQVMMPESIAIVCAPNHEPSYGIFRLTDPPGLPHIIACKKQETFHQHNIDNLYTDCDANPGGHVFESNKLDFKIHDLRQDG